MSSPEKRSSIEKKSKSPFSRIIGGIALIAAGVLSLVFINHHIGNITKPKS